MQGIYQNSSAHSNSSSPLPCNFEIKSFLLAFSYLRDMANHKSLDLPSLLWVTLDVLNRATAAADKCLEQRAGSIEIKGTYYSKSDFPVHDLKKISCKVGCKAANDGHDAAFFKETIPQILSKYTNSSAGKAVLILAAFALDYGELWLLYENFNKKQFTESLGHLRRVNDLTEHKSFKDAAVDLNNLVKRTMAFIRCIFEQEMMELSISNGPDWGNVPHFPDTQHNISRYSDVAIQIVAYCIFQVACFSQKRVIIIKSMRDWTSFLEEMTTELKTKQKIWREYVEDTKVFMDLTTIFRNRDGVTEFIKKFIFCIHVNPQMNVGDFHPQMVCGGSEEKVSVEMLKKKNIVLFISGIDIAENDIEDLKLFSQELKEDYKEYEIVWIPIVEAVEQWETTEQKRKFEDLQKELPVYTVDQYRPFGGMIRFVKEEWHFSSKPMVVLIDQRGSVKYRGEFQIIRTVGMRAVINDGTPPTADYGMTKIFHRHVTILEAIQQEKYIFFYGGRDSKWVQKFRVKVEKLQVDIQLDSRNIFLESFCIEKGGNDGDKELIERFWSGIQSLLNVSMQYWGNDSGSVSKEIQRLFSYKNETGWALLCKGSSILLSGHGRTIFSVLNDYSKWKGKLSDADMDTFQVYIREYHEQVVKQTRLPCLHLEIRSFGKWLPEPIRCPDCDRTIEMVITYNCCHGKDKENGYGRVLEMFSDATEFLKALDPIVNAIIQWLLPRSGLQRVPRYVTFLLLLLAFVFVLVNKR